MPFICGGGGGGAGAACMHHLAASSSILPSCHRKCHNSCEVDMLLHMGVRRAPQALTQP